MFGAQENKKEKKRKEKIRQEKEREKIKRKINSEQTLMEMCASEVRAAIWL